MCENACSEGHTGFTQSWKGHGKSLNLECAFQAWKSHGNQ